MLALDGDGVYKNPFILPAKRTKKFSIPNYQHLSALSHPKNHSQFFSLLASSKHPN